MTLTDGVTRGSVAVGGVRHGGETVSVGVGSVQEGGVSLSAPLSESLGAPGHEGGGSSWVSSDSGSISVRVVTVITIEWFRFS